MKRNASTNGIRFDVSKGAILTAKERTAQFHCPTMTLQTALANAYLQGVADAGDVVRSRRPVGMQWAKNPARGASWGLEYPFLCGELTPGNWAIWERSTGYVIREFGSGILAREKASKASYRMNRICPDPTMPAQLDAEP